MLFSTRRTVPSRTRIRHRSEVFCDRSTEWRCHSAKNPGAHLGAKPACAKNTAGAHRPDALLCVRGLTDDEPGIFGLRPPAADSPPRNRFFGAISGAERKASCEKSTFLRSGCQMALALALYPQVLSQGFAQERRIFRARLLAVLHLSSRHLLRRRVAQKR